ncbi:23S rRNA (uracil-5-)-methyltransferase RumA [Marinitoga hydrogenitolerans DSM 16785]|uniref:23S rRNA (Uracil-5-)-methyltransferase RumA n=1 Tax=Marinitoga hydrogenitolerans (strain DSM 16785 / JCM 12826 / AT1271) TaxID=1122195 RepID=A0A1M4W4G5_MARH1|nr:23S rRNA (uracil(1939)-C(5))-methyltransferase RlmD [Marinitoga hydrogenitolerans]SHE76040.1 23S rRNA (uracil-5-)-methyltransferase RumA [Marinitoga hydrogenitolerans DSM 16785]
MELCDVFGKCGGCSYLDIEYEKQLNQKTEDILKILKDSNIEIKNYEGVLSSPLIYHYRNKMEYSFGNEFKDGPLTIGLRGKGKFYDVYSAKTCKIAPEDFGKIIEFSEKFFKDLPFRNYRKHKGYLRHLVMRKGFKTNEILLNISTSSEDHHSIIGKWSEEIRNLKLEGKIVSIYHTITDSKATVVKPDNVRKLYGKDYFVENVLGINFKIGPFSFLQTNTLGSEILYSKVLDYLDKDAGIGLDLYCGAGTITLLMAKKLEKVVGVEIIKEAVNAAKENAKENNVRNVDFYLGDAKDVVKNLNMDFETVVVDPPRAGLHKNVINFIMENKFNNVIYVSCNPSNFARDMIYLKEIYNIEKFVFVDMFPHTKHLESVALLKRNKSY